MKHDDASESERGTGEVLLVGDASLTQLVGETLEADGQRCDRAGCVREARRRVLESRYDAIVLDLDSLAGGALEVVQLVAKLSPSTICVLRSRSVSADSVLSAMRAGLGDYLGGTLSVPQIRTRLRAAVQRSRKTRQRLEHLARVAGSASALVTGEATAEPSSAAATAPMSPRDSTRGGRDASPATNAATDNEGHGRRTDTGIGSSRERGSGPARESGSAPSRHADFADAAGQQLDPERLVTVAIEHLVDQLGPVNVAIYLGTGSARFGLAAYARADLPRAVIERPLAEWSGSVCLDAALDGRPSVHLDASRLPGVQEPELAEAAAFSRRGAIVVPCRVQGVCDAVFVILTPVGTWPLDGVGAVMSEFGRIFGGQLARIQRIHSRHRGSWPVEDE